MSSEFDLPLKPSLDACISKIDRAKEHIDAINDQIMAGKIRVDPRALRAKYQFKLAHAGAVPTNEVIFHIIGPAPRVPLIFSILVGEVVYHLRSALDHLVYQLIIAKTKQPPTFKSAFPIVWCGKDRRIKSALKEYEAQSSRLKQDISMAAVQMIHDLQPFHRGAAFQDDPLWMLNELNNADKHRVLNLTVHGISHYTVKVLARGHQFDATFQPKIHFEAGAEIGRLRLLDGASYRDYEVQVDGDLIIAVALDQVGQRQNEPVIPFLTQLSDYVMGIVRAFMTLPELEWTTTWERQHPPPWKSLDARSTEKG